MAEQPESSRNAPRIARAGKRKWGYNPEQVDEFLERTHALYDSEDGQLTQQDIQNVSFDLCKDGYVISQVDAALGRLERALVDQQTTREITRHGRVTWKAQTEDLYRTLAMHAGRAKRQRFRAGGPAAPSYDRKQVDRIVDQVLDKAAAELGVDGMTADNVRDLVDLNSTSVANVIFTQRRGRRGYDERQVDNYLNACVRLLSRLESYARVSSYVNDPASTPQQDLTSDRNASQAAALFSAREETAAFDDVSPTVMADDFAALHRAEEQIFAASSAPTPTLVPPAPQTSVPTTSVSTTSAPAVQASASAPAPQTVTPVPVPAPPAPTVVLQPATDQTDSPVPDAAATAPLFAAETIPAPVPQAPAPETSDVMRPSGDTALSDLAHLAASVQAPAAQPVVSEPQVPDLNLPIVPTFSTLDIPDLSFPSFDDDDKSEEKKTTL